MFDDVLKKEGEITKRLLQLYIISDSLYDVIYGFMHDDLFVERFYGIIIHINELLLVTHEGLVVTCEGLRHPTLIQCIQIK